MTIKKSLHLRTKKDRAIAAKLLKALYLQNWKWEYRNEELEFSYTDKGVCLSDKNGWVLVSCHDESMEDWAFTFEDFDNYVRCLAD